MAIIDGNKIGPTDISGRDIGVLLREKPFLYTYPDGISRLSYDVWQLCRSSNINKWAKYSPLTKGGTNIPFKNMPSNSPWEQQIWEYAPTQIDEARLGDFGNYNHESLIPISGGFPDELYKNTTNIFTVGFIPDEGTLISINDVFNASELHFGVSVREKNNPSSYFWCANKNKGSSSVTLDLKPFGGLPTGSIVEVCMFYSTATKEAMDPDIVNDYYSIRADENVVWIKEYTIKNYTPPIQWESLTIKYEPLVANWADDMVWFDDVWVELVSKYNTSYQFNIRITTPDDRYSVDFAMLKPKYVEAGVNTIIVNTGYIELPMYQYYNMVFIQVLDKQNANKIIAEIPVTRFIEH